LVFVHLSDLHFRAPGHPLAEREAALRDALLEDIPRTVGRVTGKLEAVLLTGDLARAAQSEEYREARLWLNDLCDRLKIHPTQTLTCPGNHDVNWTRLDAGRRAINTVLRNCEPHLLDAAIDDLLLDEPDTVLAPLENYQEFAAAYACDIEKCLAWDLPPIPFGNGYALAIRGANSVINSDGKDAEGTMAVHLNQLLATRKPGLVRMLLMHHGTRFWVRPNPSPAKCHHNIVLYGHTHSPDHNKPSDTCLEITAGAVHPEESEQFAVPGYNVIEISIEGSPDLPDDLVQARVRVFHREFSRSDNAFVEDHGVPQIDDTVEILRAVDPETRTGNQRSEPSDDGLASTADSPEEEGDVDGETETQPPLETPSGEPDPSRLVRSEFELLGAGDRVRLLDRLGIPTEEITVLPPHRQIREVSRRVIADGDVSRFLAAVSKIIGR
jgi:predicted MPP superfamily phosphohydrolase